MKLFNRTNNTVFLKLNSLPNKLVRGRPVPLPTIKVVAQNYLDLTNFFSEDEIKLIRESQEIPRGFIWEDQLLKVNQPKPTVVSNKDPLPAGSRSVLNRLNEQQSNSSVPEASIEEVSSEEIEQMQDALGGLGSDLELPDGENEVMPSVNVSAEETPTKEELAEIEGRRPAQSWRRRQLWVWAYENKLRPADFANKREIWDLIKNHLDS